MSRQRRQKVVRRIVCARCDKTLADPSKRLFSSWSKLHYCADINGCARRAARLKKKSVSA